MIVAAQFMVVIDVAIVNVALPSIKTDLHFSQESLQWVITAYSIFFGGVLLLGAHQVGRGGAWCATAAGHAAMAGGIRVRRSIPVRIPYRRR